MGNIDFVRMTLPAAHADCAKAESSLVEAVTGSRPLQDLDSVAVQQRRQPHRQPVRPDRLARRTELLGADGPTDIVRRVRRAEARTSGVPDARVPDDASRAG